MRTSMGMVLGCLAVLAAAPAAATANQAAGSQPFVGTWRLVSVDRGTAGQPPAPIANPTGILIQDARGNVIEIATRAGRVAPMDFAGQAATYEAFWGSYTADPGAATIRYQIKGDLNPGRTGQAVTRAYAMKGPQLVLTETSATPAVVTRRTWERVPELEALPDYQRDAIGFWHWMSAGLVDSSGAIVQRASRDASVIVYTPTGLMAVIYLPPPGRKPYAAALPTNDEARAAIQGSATYFGPYVVQPKSSYVIHYQLGSPNPAATGSSMLRNFAIKGSELILTFPPTTLNGQPVRNVVHLTRIGGLADMWPDFGR